MSTEDEFYEEDEPLDDVLDAWRRGEPGETSGSRRVTTGSAIETIFKDWA